MTGNSLSRTKASNLLQLLLWPQLRGSSALLLPAVGCSRWETGVALSADHLIAVVLGSQGLQGRLDDTSSETEDQLHAGVSIVALSSVEGSVRGGWTPSGCCSRKGYVHPRAACQRRSIAAGPGAAEGSVVSVDAPCLRWRCGARIGVLLA